MRNLITRLVFSSGLDSQAILANSPARLNIDVILQLQWVRVAGVKSTCMKQVSCTSLPASLQLEQAVSSTYASAAVDQVGAGHRRLDDRSLGH